MALLRKSSKTSVERSALGLWLEAKRDLVAAADEVLAPRLADRHNFGDPTCMDLCASVFDVVSRSLSLGGTTSVSASGGPESSSVLLLGEPGSGKTHIVEWCISQLREAQSSLAVLRARGGAYATDVECLRHLATQLTTDLVAAPRGNASFEAAMEWLRNLLSEHFKQASAVVIVLDRFEHFCSKTRQTLLYNLFDIAQEVGVRLSIIGMSERMDVMGMLEKRIRSRFSMRHLHTFLPRTMEDLIRLLMVKFRLPRDCGLNAPFLKQLHGHVEAALRSKGKQWQAHLDLGRPPTWFLWQCLPLSSLLQAAAEVQEAPAAKRLRGAPQTLGGCCPSSTTQDTRALLLGSLSESEHVVLLALWRLASRQASVTLARALYEVQALHERGGLVTAFAQDRYCAAFERLCQLHLVEVASVGSGEAARRHQACFSSVDAVYEALARDLHDTSSSIGRRQSPTAAAAMAATWNPLKTLPEPVQQWATRPVRCPTPSAPHASQVAATCKVH